MSCSQWGTVQRRALSHEAQKCGTPPQRNFSPEGLRVCLVFPNAPHGSGAAVAYGAVGYSWTRVPKQRYF
jgi:hypothetical protein